MKLQESLPNSVFCRQTRQKLSFLAKIHNAIIRGEKMQLLNPTSAMKHGDIIWCRKPECPAITNLIKIAYWGMSRHKSSTDKERQGYAMRQ